MWGEFSRAAPPLRGPSLPRTGALLLSSPPPPSRSQLRQLRSHALTCLLLSSPAPRRPQTLLHPHYLPLHLIHRQIAFRVLSFPASSSLSPELPSSNQIDFSGSFYGFLDTIFFQAFSERPPFSFSATVPDPLRAVPRVPAQGPLQTLKSSLLSLRFLEISLSFDRWNWLLQALFGPLF